MGREGSDSDREEWYVSLIGRADRRKGFAAARSVEGRRAAAPYALLGEGAVDLDLGRSLGQSFLFASLAVGGEVLGLAMHIEGSVVLVHLVEDEEIGVFRRAMRPIDEAAGLCLADDAGLLGEQRRQGIALALCRPDLRHHREYVRH